MVRLGAAFFLAAVHSRRSSTPSYAKHGRRRPRRLEGLTVLLGFLRDCVSSRLDDLLDDHDAPIAPSTTLIKERARDADDRAGGRAGISSMTQGA
jgi:hypothetical protein